MKIIVTGSSGQLGQELMKLLPEDYRVYGLARTELDVTNAEQVIRKITALNPDVVIHCAAYTSVDQAETESDQAYLVNSIGTGNVAIASEKVGAKQIFISTDYVFDGNKQTPYKEHDETNPRTVYGRSKLAGEQLVKMISSKYFIVRTSWLFGKFGPNFVKTMLRLANESDEVKVVNDQIGSPTYTVDLVLFLEQLMKTEKYGIYHASNMGSCSWYDFAKEIFSINNKRVNLQPCLTEQYPRPAPRPRYSVLDNDAIRLHGFRPLPPWRDALVRFSEEMKKN